MGQFADKMIVGALVGLGLWIVGMPFAFLLGLLTGLLGLIPYVGVTVSLVPPVLLALASSPVEVLWRFCGCWRFTSWYYRSRPT